MKSSTDRLADASEKGLVNEVESYLDAGIDPDISGSDGVAPIVRATANGHSHIAKILLRKGAAVDTVHPASGKSALHLAAQSGQVVLAKVLLAGGAEIEKTDKDGATPLQLAAGGKSGDMVRALIAAGAHVDVVDAKNAHTVLHRAALSGNAEVVEKLLRVGADLEGRDRAGGTALHLAAKEGRLGLVRCLVRSGGDPGAVDMIGRNPLYIAAAQGHTKIVMELERSGSDPAAMTIGGICALTAAAEGSQVQVIEALLQLGLPALGGRRAWADALCVSARRGLISALQQLLSAGGLGGLPGRKFLVRTGTSPLHCASACGELQCVMMLLQAGADETALNADRCTPLEIVGTLRETGLENPALDERIRRALIKAFLYRSKAWLWPTVVNRCTEGHSPIGPTASGRGALRKDKIKSAKQCEVRRKASLSNPWVCWLQRGGRPAWPAAIFRNIVRYGRKAGEHIQ